MTCGEGRNDGEPLSTGFTRDMCRGRLGMLATSADLFALVVQRTQVSNRSKKGYYEKSSVANIRGNRQPAFAAHLQVIPINKCRGTV